MYLSSETYIKVVLPQAATPREVFAAEELVKYLGMICGARLKTVSDVEPVQDPWIALGGPERNRLTAQYMTQAEFDKEVPGPEGILVRSFGDSLVLAGSSKNPTENERGTIYAVYEFLERYCGCSFAAFTNPEIPGGEYIPTCKELNLPEISYCKACADDTYRTAIVQYGDSAGKMFHELNLPFLDWLVKNRYNRILTWMKVYDGMKVTGLLEEAVKRGISFTVGHHDAARHFMPPYGNEHFPEKYYETHPEYYKLLEDGGRFCITDHWGQCVFCSRNDAIYEVLADNITRWIAENPLVDTIAFWPQDGRGPDCACEECRKHTKVENYTYFMNELAKRVGAVYPHVKIDMLLYVDLWNCPENVELSPNLMVDEAVWHDTGLRNAGKPDGSCLTGTFFEEDLLKWHKAGACAVYYEYYMGVYGSRNRLVPMADEIQSRVKRFTEVGIDGAGTQIECFNTWNNIFNFYCFARTSYDHELSMEDNLDMFCRIFGAGGEKVKTIVLLCEDCYDGQTDLSRGGQYLMEHIDKQKIYQCYEDAFAAAETPFFRNNLRLMRMAFRYSDLECQESAKMGETDYERVKTYQNMPAELMYMTAFDSYYHNRPGYGIMIPVQGTVSGTYEPDKWTIFETGSRKKIQFTKGDWEDRLVHAYTARFQGTAKFVQEETCVRNSANEASADGFDYISLVSKEKYGSGTCISATCDFEAYGAPLLVFPHALTADENGELRYSDYHEVVLYENGINVWTLYRDGEAIKYDKVFASKFPVEAAQQHRISVTLLEKGLEIFFRNHHYYVQLSDLPEQVHVGLTACEGINRFYDFTIENP